MEFKKGDKIAFELFNNSHFPRWDRYIDRGPSGIWAHGKVIGFSYYSYGNNKKEVIIEYNIKNSKVTWKWILEECDKNLPGYLIHFKNSPLYKSSVQIINGFRWVNANDI